MNLRMKITDVLSGGAITALIGERDRARDDAASQRSLVDMAAKATRQISDDIEREQAELRSNREALRSENAAMKRALEQIGKELTDLIDMPQHRRTTTALRAIRALTKGPHK